MPTLTERDFAKLAAAAAKDLVDHQIPLNDSVDKIASSYDMNDEQLTRLCEATNNCAFNALFEAKGKTGSTDRLVEFDVAKVGQILNKRRDDVKSASTKTASVGVFDYAWEARPLGQPSLVSDVETVKTASEQASEVVDDRGASSRQFEKNARVIAKAMDHLNHEKIAADLRSKDACESLYRHFRPVDRKLSFPAFEKDAMAVHGAAADEILDELRTTLRLPAVDRDYSKVANYIVDTVNTPEHALFKIALEARKQCRDIEKTLQRYGRG